MNRRPGTGVPRAHHFDAAFCSDPECGLHIAACAADGEILCEIVMSAEQTLALVEICQENLYDKATRRGEP